MLRRSDLWTGLLCVAAALNVGLADLSTAHAENGKRQDKKRLSEGEELYFGGNYEDALFLLEELAQRDKIDKKIKTKALKYIAFCYFLLEAKDQAKGAWLKLLETDPTFALDPVEESPEFVNFFNPIKPEKAAPAAATTTECKEGDPKYEECKKKAAGAGATPATTACKEGDPKYEECKKKAAAAATPAPTCKEGDEACKKKAAATAPAPAPACKDDDAACKKKAAAAAGCKEGDPKYDECMKKAAAGPAPPEPRCKDDDAECKKKVAAEAGCKEGDPKYDECLKKALEPAPAAECKEGDPGYPECKKKAPKCKEGDKNCKAPEPEPEVEGERGCGIVLCLIPLGVGQYANGQIVKGIIFSVLEPAFLGLNIGFYYWNQSEIVGFSSTGVPIYANPRAAQDRYIAQLVFFSGLIASVVLGVIDAFVFY